ncbi:MAG: hypothetical protein GWO24_13315, partial [Akkermansiaceae bacterium]|nr:hypothetical protein [Akkermansiaceae bacterium]
PPLRPVEEALAVFQEDSGAAARLDALRHLMLHLGDISTNEAKRRIDAGYTANQPDGLAPG